MCDISLNGVNNSSDIYDSVTNKATFISLNDVTNSSDIYDSFTNKATCISLNDVTNSSDTCDSFTNKAACISLNDVTNSSDICDSFTNKATCISLKDVTNSSDIYDSVSYKRGPSTTVTSESVTKRTVRCRNISIIALFAILVLAVVVVIVVLVVLKQSGHATATTVSTSVANTTATTSASTTVAVSSTVTTGTASVGPPTTTTPPDTGLHDCREVYESGQHVTGVYSVNVNVGGQLQHHQVYCDMDTPPGGWTVFQKRFDGSVDFYRYFYEYESWFGDLHGEFWLGLKWVYWMTLSQPTALFINLTGASSGNETFVRYESFSLGRPPGYNLHVSSYSGMHVDGLSYSNGMPFSTRDHDVDDYPGNCAEYKHAGYWFNNCADSNLNGNYGGAYKATLRFSGFTWQYPVQLSHSQMAFRRT